MDPVLMIALRGAIAGPTGVSLGWWLGRRGERDRTGREERKSAYAAFLGAAIRFRFATDEERRVIRDERWAGLSEVILVAPPQVVQRAAYWVSTGDRLLDPGLTPEQRRETFDELWANNVAFTRLARADLGIETANPFEGFQPSITEDVTFGHPAPGPAPNA
jgi:hypothetical protein